MHLSSLAAVLKAPSATTPLAEGADPQVSGVTHNSSWVKPGDAFVAVRGASDGHRYATEAIERGAVAVIGEGLPDGMTLAAPYLQVDDARVALAVAAAELAGHPSAEMTVVGVTGTDGKTTTSWLTRHLLRAAGLPTGLLSTVGYELADGVLQHFPAHFTTPEAPEVQATLAQMRDGGARAVVLEASSHALALHRVHCVDVDVAVWTHLSSEHLDFHGTVEQYFADKRRLVEMARYAVLNADDPWTEQLRGIAPAETTYGVEAPADWRAREVRELGQGLAFVVDSPQGTFEAELPMIGAFNVSNALAAMAAASQVGASVDQLREGLASFAGVPGRMELVPDIGPAGPTGVRVVVDFAHTPPSLDKALATLRVTTERELWVLLGSAGGPRDPSKRAPLGEVASRMADHVVFTEEDHRDTPLEDILREMERGAREAGRENFVSIGDRRDAIRYAVDNAQPGDTVVLAGKGPEETLERETETIPWDEVSEAVAALATRGLS